MENYSKGKNIEEPLERGKIPIPDLPAHFLWMQVNGGSKMRNLLGYALKSFKEEQERVVVWSGSGAGMGKAISCAEIMKRRNKHLHQVNKICYRKVEEFWEPRLEDLDPLVVVREVPTIHILLSKDDLNTAEPGYQAPGSFDAFWRKSQNVSSDQHRRPGPPSWKNKTSRISSDQFAAMGLRSNQKRLKNTGSDRTNVKNPTQKQANVPNSHNQQ